MEGHGHNLNDNFGASLRRSRSDGDGGVISLLSSPETSPTKAAKPERATPVKAKSLAKAAALSPRMQTADTNADEVISISSSVDPSSQNSTAAAASANPKEIIRLDDTDDEDDNSGYRGNDIYDIEGDTGTLDPLIDGEHLSVRTYTEFEKHPNELFTEVERLVQNGLFSTLGKLGIGVGGNGKRGPVYTSGGVGVNQAPRVVKKFLTDNNATLILGFIGFWEGICDKNDMEIVDIFFTNYRDSYEDELEKITHESAEDWIEFGRMLKHGDRLPGAVISRVTATMFEQMMNNGKVKKRFSVENKDENFAEVSFAAGNGTTVIMDSYGSGNTSNWKHGVEGAEGTYTITLQIAKRGRKKGWKKGLKKTKDVGAGEGKLKDPANYPSK